MNKDLNRENKIIKDVIEKYKLEAKSIEHLDFSYKITCEEDVFSLNLLKPGKFRANNDFYIIEELNNKGFKNIPLYIKTDDGKYFVSSKNKVFYLAKFMSGEKCAMNTIEEAKASAKLLAKFHNSLLNINMENLKLKNELKKWGEMFKKDLRDFESFEKIVGKKKIKSSFDNIYLKYMDRFYERGLAALRYLNSSDYFKIVKNIDGSCICHDMFYSSVIHYNDDYYLEDIDNLVIDLPFSDFSKLIRKLMFKEEYKFDFEKAREIIEAYSEESPLSKKDIEMIFFQISFPHKYWKLGYKKYMKHKAWSEEKYIRKLNLLVNYIEEEDKFINDFINYMEKYN